MAKKLLLRMLGRLSIIKLRITPVEVESMLAGKDKKTSMAYFEQVRRDVWVVMQQVERIKTVATEKGYSDILDIILEEV